MATEIVTRVVPGGLMAVNEAEASKMEALIGQQVMARITRPRNLEFHRRFFAMLKTTLDMVDLNVNMEQWRHMVTVGAGHCTWVELGNLPIPIPKSISFTHMDQVEFERVYADAITFICDNYLEQNPAQLRQIIEDFV